MARKSKGTMMREKEIKAALDALPFSVKAFFPGALERALLNQAQEIDRLREDYAFLRSQIVERK
jgi:hypothetical protein